MKLPVGDIDRRLADQDPEAVGLVLDVVQQRQGRLLEQLARVARGQRGGDPVEQVAAPRGPRPPRRALPCRRSARRRPAWRPSARAATSSMEVASKPRSANSARPTSISCSRRWAADIRTRDFGDTGGGGRWRAQPLADVRCFLREVGHPLIVPAGGHQRRRPASHRAGPLRPAHVVAQPSFSKIQMSRALMSIWPRSRRRGGRRSGRRGAGCASSRRSDRIASGQKLPALSPSRVSNGRSPYTWQIELIDQVTWCSRPMRTSAGPEERRTARPATTR